MRKFLILFVLGLIVFFVAFIWWKNGLAPVNVKSSVQKIFVISKGTPIRTIGNDLKEQGLIRDPVVFFLYIKKNGFDQDVQAGSYRLSSSMDLVKIMETLRHGNIDVWITVPEGLRSEEIAAILEKNIPSYKAFWKADLKAEEGYLFPDTYLIPKETDINQIISIMKNNFIAKITSIGLTQESPNLKKTITTASLIEREAKFAEDRPSVASVIQNRLDSGVALQIDATLQYALGYDQSKKTWWSVPRAKDLKIDSPYNTYTNVGLPPGPICNPGLSAIEAAAKPADTSYVYYVNDSSGKLHFAKNLTEHNKNVTKYLQ